MLIFAEGGKPQNPAEKNPRSKGENQQQLNSHMTPSPEIVPETKLLRHPRFPTSAVFDNDVQCFQHFSDLFTKENYKL
jgi:hypothetical protein